MIFEHGRNLELLNGHRDTDVQCDGISLIKFMGINL